MKTKRIIVDTKRGLWKYSVSIEEHLAWIKKIPKAYRDTGRIRIENTYDNQYSETEIILELSYARPLTLEEQKENQ